MRKLLAKDIVEISSSIVVVALFFVVISFVAKEYDYEIQLLVAKNSIAGMIIFVAANAFSVIIAPLSTLPLIPLASAVWGWFVAGTLSVAGWLLGAEIAFLIGRYFGKPLVAKIISINKLEKLEKQVPENNLFWTVVFLRMFVSVDLLSYALGLFSTMKNSSYIVATLLGIIPFAYIFAYTGTLSVVFQVLVLSTGLLIALLWYVYKNKTEK